MALGRYVVDAVVIEGRSPIELARTHGISQSWIYELVGRFREGVTMRTYTPSNPLATTCR
jgi:transposase